MLYEGGGGETEGERHIKMDLAGAGEGVTVSAHNGGFFFKGTSGEFSGEFLQHINMY